MRIRRLDSYLSEWKHMLKDPAGLLEGVRPIRLMKIDCEGMELELLQGSVDVLTYFRPILYVEDSTSDPKVNVDLDLHARPQLIERFPSLFPQSSSSPPPTALTEGAAVDD